MDRIPDAPPIIFPLDSFQDRPVWSVMIPVYNCSIYVPQVLRSVLKQDMGEAMMQIEVVDDASTDADVGQMVEELGEGRVSYFRQAENVGSLRNFETCINRSNGKFVHLLHGDDLVKEGFYKKITQLFINYPEAGAAFSNYDFINGSGEVTHTSTPETTKERILTNWLQKVAGRQRIQYAAMVVKREVYEKLGGFYGACYGEDWEMWVRIAKSYPVVYTPEVLAQYRVHSNTISWNHALSGQLYWDLLFVINQIKKHLPEKDRQKVLRESRFNFAKNLLGLVYKNLDNGQDFSVIRPYLVKIFHLSKHPFILAHLGNIYFKIIRSYSSRQLSHVLQNGTKLLKPE